MKDYYKILNATPSSSPEEIKKQFRNLALTYHPDRNKAKDAHDRFIDINEAYQVLSDENSRRQYDAYYGKNSHQDLANIFDDELNKQAQKGREDGEKYAKGSYDDFIYLLGELIGSGFLEGIVDAMGNLISGAIDAISDLS